MTRRTLQGLSFNIQSPSHLALANRPDIEIAFVGDQWQLWGQRSCDAEPLLLQTASGPTGRDDLIGIVAWSFGLRAELPEGFRFLGD